MQTSFCSPQKKWRTPHAKTEHHSLRSATFHLSASWADGQFYVAGHQFRGRKVSGMDRRWHSGGAHRPWAFADHWTFRASRSGGKLYGKQNALFWARRTSGLAILLMLFFHIGVFGRVQDGVYILFPFTTVRLLTQLFTGCFGICASSAQSPTPSGIAGHRPG